MIKDGTQIGKYTILAFIDGGAFGQVYKVRDITMGRISALKIIPIDASKTNINEVKGIVEARTQFSCDHQNTVELRSVEVYPIEDLPYVAIEMEFFPDGSVQNQLKTRFLSIDESSSLIIGILYGLQHAHNRGILHRDVKPGNILLKNGVPKLSDFGISSANKDENGFGSAQGYTTHCAPELFSTGKSSELTDIYATGITYYRLVNNIQDWAGFTKDSTKLLETGSLIKNRGYAPWVPRQVKRIINKACAPDPKKRFQSCQHLRQAIEKLKFQNDWILDGTEWLASKNKNEIINLTKKKKFKVEHTIDGKRRRVNCQSFDSQTDAKNHALEIVISTTLKAR